jgi:hypothetical protein
MPVGVQVQRSRLPVDLGVADAAHAQLLGEGPGLAEQADDPLAPVEVNLAAVYGRPEEAAVHEAWVGDFAAVLRRGDARAYVNFLGAEGRARVHEAYPGSTWARLAAVKARYDPTNLFHLNQDIPPTTAAPDDEHDPRAAA